MEQTVKEDILSILNSAITAFKEKDSFRLREISDHTVHNASIYQDKDSITVAVIMYSLSKIIDRSGISPEMEYYLETAKNAIEENNIEAYEESIKDIIDLISTIDRKLNMYIQRVIQEAQIKKGSRLYEHGISLAKTAELLGISQWELMKYVGHTNIADSFDDEVNVDQRLEHLRGLFD